MIIYNKLFKYIMYIGYLQYYFHVCFALIVDYIIIYDDLTISRNVIIPKYTSSRIISRITEFSNSRLTY